jgi:hypothetical protein
VFRSPAEGLPEVVRDPDALPRLPQRHPGMVLGRLRAADDADQAAGRDWDGWFTDRRKNT